MIVEKGNVLGLNVHRNIDMTHGSAFGIRKILICGAGMCYLVILRGEGGIAKKVTALWFVLFRLAQSVFFFQRERTRGLLDASWCSKLVRNNNDVSDNVV